MLDINSSNNSCLQSMRGLCQLSLSVRAISERESEWLGVL